MHTPVLADLAVRVPITSPDTPMGEIEAVLRADPELLGIVTSAGDDLYLIDRGFLDMILAGRLGYGRALLHRRPLRSCCDARPWCSRGAPSGATRRAPRCSGRTRSRRSR